MANFWRNFSAEPPTPIFLLMDCVICGTSGVHSAIRGSHHIFFREGIEEIINLQPKGQNAKPYQVKQVRNIVTKYKLSIE
jgi:hypothetical protein